MAEAGPLRLFVAVELPEPIRQALSQTIAGLRSELKGPYRWVTTNMHLTLKFLGDVEPARVDRLSRSLTEAAASLSPFELHLEGAGTFPNGRDPRVVWAGLGGDGGALTALRDAVERAMVEAGEDPDTRAFHPHLTLARMTRRLDREAAEQLRERLAAVRFDSGSAFEVDGVGLIRSELRPEGARYTRLAHAPLAGG